jgi:antirestriction protein ArdC
METTKKAISKTYTDIYQEVTDTVIKALEQGTVIWQCSWNETSLPKNVTTNLHYRGWNLFLLNFYTIARNYSTASYITFKQAQQLGGTIKKGEKGVKIIYWATIELKADKEIQVQAVEPDDDKKRTKLVPKAYIVFNIDQTEGIQFPEVISSIKTTAEKITACDEVVAAMPNPPKLKIDGHAAYYQPALDLVVVPSIAKSVSSEGYYSTLFHELAHSTGHESRLNRKELMQSDGFGSSEYAREELTAEMTAAFLCAITGIQDPTIDNSAAYIESWLRVLKNDKMLVLKAATQAQRAADYILNVKKE